MAPALLAALMLPWSAFADESGKEAALAEVTVTGSRIIRSDLTARTPLNVLSSDDILSAGTLSLTELLRSDLSTGSGQRGQSNTLNGFGGVGVELRNLGTQRTLLLVNGRRYPFNTDILGQGTQDISTIPTVLLQRIEILRDGASTTYGADAVAGVVNFILQDDFEGSRVEAYGGTSDDSDGFAYRVSGLFGNTSERGSIVFGAQYQKQDLIPTRRREWATNIVTSFAGAGTYNTAFTPGGTVLRATGSAALACYGDDGGPNLAPACPRYDESRVNTLVLGSTIRSFGGVAHYDLGEHVRANAQAFFSRRDSQQDRIASELDTTAPIGPFGSIVIPATSSNNPYGEAIRLRWRPAQYGSRATNANSDLFWGTFGLSGDLGERFRWDASYTHAENRGGSAQSGWANANNFNLLLNPVSCAADAQCSKVGSIADIQALLTGVAPLTALQQDYLFFTQTTDSKWVTEQTLATATGPLLKLPAGDLIGAIGAEYRQESGRMDVDPITESGIAAGTFVFPTRGSFSTREAFAELEIPIAANQFALQELSLNLQGRYSDFSNFGDTQTYKAGLNFAPTQDVRIRTGYGTSYRAPNLNELYRGGSASFGSYVDPCVGGGLRATDATVEANCTALGVSDTFVQTSSPIKSAGNPSLKPERGRSFNIGIVFEPHFWSGFSSTIDYYRIEVRDSISNSTQLQQFLNSCYQDPDFATRAMDVNDGCHTFDVRTPSGSLVRINSRQTNVGTLTTSGVDASAHYGLEGLGSSPWSLVTDLHAAYVLSNEQAGIERVGTFVGGRDGALSFPRWRAALNLTLARGPLAVNWETEFTAPMTDSVYGTTVPIDNFLDYSGTPQYFLHNMSVAWDILEHMHVNLGINNVFDKDPPYAFVTSRNTLTSTYDQIGRYFYTTVRYSF